MSSSAAARRELYRGRAAHDRVAVHLVHVAQPPQVHPPRLLLERPAQGWVHGGTHRPVQVLRDEALQIIRSM